MTFAQKCLSIDAKISPNSFIVLMQKFESLAQDVMVYRCFNAPDQSFIETQNISQHRQPLSTNSAGQRPALYYLRISRCSR